MKNLTSVEISSQDRRTLAHFSITIREAIENYCMILRDKEPEYWAEKGAEYWDLYFMCNIKEEAAARNKARAAQAQEAPRDLPEGPAPLPQAFSPDQFATRSPVLGASLVKEMGHIKDLTNDDWFNFELIHREHFIPEERAMILEEARKIKDLEAREAGE